MKTKYKILIASILVLSMLTAFAVTSFAAENHTDIEYNDNTYTYNSTITNSLLYLQIWDYDSLSIYKTNGSVVSLEYDYVIIEYRWDNDEEKVFADIWNNHVMPTFYSLGNNQALYLVISGDYKYGFVSNTTFNENATNLNNTETFEYDVWYDSRVSGNTQINLLNDNQPNPLDKVNDFLGYLSTSLTKLTTMIITNQILILFIVAVPVVSFVIGSFKRIKDAGRA